MKVVRAQQRLGWWLCAMTGVAIAGCATTPTAPGDAGVASSEVVSGLSRPGPNAGRVVIRRDSGLLGVACGHAIRLDGRLLGELDSGEQVVAYPAPGEHVVDVSMTGMLCAQNNASGVSFTIEAGKSKVFRTGFSGFRLFVQLVGEENLAAPTQTLPAISAPRPAAAASRPAAEPSGQFGGEAERLARQQCAAQPRAVLAGKGPGAETYTVKCDNGDVMTVRCEFGNCRALR